MTTENNKIIAEFMQPNTKHDNFYFPQFKEPYIYQGNLNGYSEVFGIDDLKFHSDWNWLMELVEKIESLNFYFVIKHKTVKVADLEETYENITYEKSKIESVYNACLEFIKWYNQQPK